MPGQATSNQAEEQEEEPSALLQALRQTQVERVDVSAPVQSLLDPWGDAGSVDEELAWTVGPAPAGVVVHARGACIVRSYDLSAEDLMLVHVLPCRLPSSRRQRHRAHEHLTEEEQAQRDQLFGSFAFHDHRHTHQSNSSSSSSSQRIRKALLLFARHTHPAHQNSFDHDPSYTHPATQSHPSRHALPYGTICRLFMLEDSGEDVMVHLDIDVAKALFIGHREAQFLLQDTQGQLFILPDIWAVPQPVALPNIHAFDTVSIPQKSALLWCKLLPNHTSAPHLMALVEDVNRSCHLLQLRRSDPVQRNSQIDEHKANSASTAADPLTISPKSTMRFRSRRESRDLHHDHTHYDGLDRSSSHINVASMANDKIAGFESGLGRPPSLKKELELEKSMRVLSGESKASLTSGLDKLALESVFEDGEARNLQTQHQQHETRDEVSWTGSNIWHASAPDVYVAAIFANQC